MVTSTAAAVLLTAVLLSRARDAVLGVAMFALGFMKTLQLHVVPSSRQG